MSMKISDEGLALIKKFEGCRLTAYRCPAGVLTIGIGHTGADVKEGMQITNEQALKLLATDVEKFEKKVMKYDDEYHWNQNQFDALVSFAYNIGSIDQLTASGTRSVKEISEAITLYNKAGGKRLEGLARRRAAEKELFDKSCGNEQRKNKNPYCEPTRILKKGCRGNDVKWLQFELKKAGFELNIDGVLGDMTDAAIRAFQKEKNIQVDGKVGKITISKLK